MSEVQVYCLKCKKHIIMQDPQPTVSASGRTGLSGTCPDCGARVYRPTKSEGVAKKPTQSAQLNAAVKPIKKATAKAKTAKTSAHGIKNLVIVESPTKARTIQRYLGKDYNVKASIGHVRDLLRSRLSVDVEHDFTPTYRVPNDKKEVVADLKKAVQQANQIYLATDPDREGEAIAWHLMEATGIDEEKAHRVVFHEITENAIREAFANARSLDMNLINAQQARRILDRLVGYELSPFLWEKVRSGLSAGRVQSAALRLAVDREKEINAFVPEEYWTIDAQLKKQQAKAQSFKARLLKINGKEAALNNKESVDAVCNELQPALYTVEKVKQGTKKRRPLPPFTTSTLQQEAARVLKFQAARTMRIAQQLYEGVELGAQGSVGIITYMRTDSFHVADMAIQEARTLIQNNFGDDYLPEKPVYYRTRSKLAQEAHEAIRPTSILRTPESIREFLSKEQLSLYSLIWRRLVASQMQPAVYSTLTIDIAAKPQEGNNQYLFRASGSTLTFPGYLKLYGEEAEVGEESQALPSLDEQETLLLVKLLPEQHFTQAPPRYTEASLIKELESKGIGRPSTYASIISTILARDYVERKQGTLTPTELAFVVTDLLIKHFPNVMDIGFTADLENDLDSIATGNKEWVPVVANFYTPFSKLLEQAKLEAEASRPQEELAGFNCDLCGAPMLIKHGRFGKFIGCKNYPECKNTKPFLIKIGVSCPKCGGEIVQRRSHRGRIFYGCERYPNCDFISNNQPVAQRCPNCNQLMVKKGRSQVQCTSCKTVFPAQDSEQSS